MVMASHNPTTIWNSLCKLRLVGRAVALGFVIVAAWLIAGPVAVFLSGGNGIIAATVAGAVCLVGGEAGLLVGSFAGGPLTAMIGGMVRMFGILSAGLALHALLPALAAAGFIFYLLAFYMVGLFAETILFLADSSRASVIKRTV